MVFGTFDALHPGHIHFLREARKYGNYLIVSIAREKFVKKIKGRKPVHSEADRKALLESVQFVDKVVLGSKGDYLLHIIRERPDVIVLGHDQSAFTMGLKEKLAKAGLKVKIIRAKGYKTEHYQTRFLK